MRFFLISDNVDTLVGMRLAGIEGVVVHENDEIANAINNAAEAEDIAVLLITEKLVEKCSDLVYDLKLNRQHPLIVEIPDRHGNGRTQNSISRYVQDAIGLKIE